MHSNNNKLSTMELGFLDKYNYTYPWYRITHNFNKSSLSKKKTIITFVNLRGK